MTKIYHNPRCSKSRETLALLKENNIAVEVIEYLKTPLKKEELEHLAKLVGVKVKNLVRTNESEFTSMNLEGADEQTILSAIIAAPILLERPIVVHNNKAAIGRPPENVLKIFE